MWGKLAGIIAVFVMGACVIGTAHGASMLNDGPSAGYEVRANNAGPALPTP